MTTAEEGLQRHVLRLIASEFCVDEQHLSDASYFSSDLGIGSLQALEFVELCEAEFEVEIPDRVVPTLMTVGDLVRFIHAQRQGTAVTP